MANLYKIISFIILSIFSSFEFHFSLDIFFSGQNIKLLYNYNYNYNYNYKLINYFMHIFNYNICMYFKLF